jgi:hypothetical protein
MRKKTWRNSKKQRRLHPSVSAGVAAKEKNHLPDAE